jgi:hypothetical protein
MKKLIAAVILIQLFFNVSGQTLLKNHVKFTPMRLLNTYGAPGYLFNYERTLNQHNGFELSLLKVADPFRESGTNYQLGKLKGWGIGLGYRYSFNLSFITRYLFDDLHQPNFFIQPNALISHGNYQMNWTFIDQNNLTYTDDFKQTTRLGEYQILLGACFNLDKKQRVFLECFVGYGSNVREIKHFDRQNINDEAEILAEWDLTYYGWPGKRRFNGISSGLKLGFKF